MGKNERWFRNFGPFDIGPQFTGWALGGLGGLIWPVYDGYLQVLTYFMKFSYLIY